jgi:hypothetical protein
MRRVMTKSSQMLSLCEMRLYFAGSCHRIRGSATSAPLRFRPRQFVALGGNE